MIALLTILAMVAVADDSDGWARFSKISAGQPRIDVSIGTLSGAKASPPDFWFRSRLADGSLRWADTKRCRAALPSIAEMRAIEMPPDPPVDGTYIPAVTIGEAEYFLDAPAWQGYLSARVRLTAIPNTPLATWADSTLARLAPCWSSQPPVYED